MSVECECSCEHHGYCERRQQYLTSIHWQRCQSGEVERLDEIYAEISRRRVARGQPVQSPDIMPPTERLQPVPQSEWPLWAQILYRYRRSEDSGIGDTAQRLAARFGGEWWKWLSAKLGIPCGCSSRQRRWNVLYPYRCMSAARLDT